MASSSARRAAGIAARLLLVAAFAAFAWANFVHWRSSGRPSGIGTTVLEGWVAALFLVRRETNVVSGRALAWLAAPIGSFAMLFARPHDGGLPIALCESVQLVGVLVALLSLCMLGRSFGIVAANRGVKTRGPYGLVRHPAYTGYLISYVGYTVENPSARNIVLLAIATAFQLLRINEEELVLAADDAYDRYRRRVRYRLLPLVY
jgi:protein-S-isoprenylcysteine O-methyltransferase Ste14